MTSKMTPRLPEPGSRQIGTRQDSHPASGGTYPKKFHDYRPEKLDPKVDANQNPPTEAKPIPRRVRQSGG